MPLFLPSDLSIVWGIPFSEQAIWWQNLVLGICVELGKMDLNPDLEKYLAQAFENFDE